eukprot:8766592-Ditylum_brightwellii.AAC.1
MTDQQRFDMIGAIQEQLSQYSGKTRLSTPNLDKLMKESTSFMRHYTQSPSCGPARATLFTGRTVERTGVQTNDLIREEVYKKNSLLFEDKINDMRTFEQVLSEEEDYTCEYY